MQKVESIAKREKLGSNVKRRRSIREEKDDNEIKVDKNKLL
jgi:hypothetical protein